MTLNVKELARAGAQARLAAIQEEQTALLAMFPELRDGRARKTATIAAPAPTANTRKRKPMSAAQKKAVGERMKAYWTAKRAEKAGTGEGSQAEAVSNGSSRKLGRKAGPKQGRKK